MDDIFLVWNTQEPAHTHARTQTRMLARKYMRARVSYTTFK